MEILEIHNEELSWTLQEGEAKEVLLLNPENIVLRVQQHAGSQLTLHVYSIDDTSAHNQIYVEQVGKGCQTRLYGMAITKGTQQVANETHVVHTIGGGLSEQLFKYVLDGESRGGFVGDLKIVKDAQKTEAYQTNRNLLLSRTAKMRTKPQLEIYADDVKASHGASTGQMNDQAIFYMQQRGISKDEAIKLLTNAFLAEVVDKLPEEMRDEYLEKVEGRIKN